MAKMYGYVRVSTKDQCEDRQVIALKEFGVPGENILMDKISGEGFQPPQVPPAHTKAACRDICWL